MQEPFWSRLALFGLSNRTSATAFMLLSIALAIGSIALSYWNPRFLVGAAFLLATLWYAIAIRWRDNHDGWKPAK